MESKPKRFLLIGLIFVFILCFIFLYFHNSISSLLKQSIYKSFEGVFIADLSYLNKHRAVFKTCRQGQNNYTAEGCLKRKVIKRCFHLSFNVQTLQGLADTGAGTEKVAGLVKTKNVEQIHSKNGSTPCTRFVTVPAYMGRMGNQMFEIASLVGLAYTYDVIPVIPSWFPLHVHFDLPNTINTKVSGIANTRNCIAEKSAVFYDFSKEFSSQANISVHGYLQSWKYFVNATDIIRSTFTFKPKHLINAKRFLSNVSIDGYQRVCIHVRRGDLILKSGIDKGHVVAGSDFIEKAKTFFLNKYTRVQFLVVSDDKPWCRRNLKGVVISPLKNPGDEMALMKLSDHVIMTVGTFGWWGAWLSGGTTVYFDTYARPGSRLASRMSKDDYFPHTWIGIS